MPKKVKLIINLSLSAVMLALLIFKLCRTLLHWEGLSELWEFDKGVPSVPVLLYVFGAYPLMLVTALGLWLRGAAAIALSAAATCCSFVMYIIELLFVSLFSVQYTGPDPLVTAVVNMIALYALVIAIADTVIRRKNRKRSIRQ